MTPAGGRGRGQRPAGLTSSFASVSSTEPLTPRTPHSRAGRAAEEGRIPTFIVDNNDANDEGEGDDHDSDDARQQRAPLLHSSASATFPLSRRDDDDVQSTPTQKTLRALGAAHRNPGLVVGCIAAIFLLGMIYLSLCQPTTLAAYIGHTNASSASTAPSSASSAVDLDVNLISYANYTHFPLAPLEYKHECRKMTHDFEPSGGYWDGAQDVPHGADLDASGVPVCAKTVTYMLDGYVGLFADLALLAQAAGIAREFNRTFFVDDTYWIRGKWTDHFRDVSDLAPGPEPGCRLPPPEEFVACPRSARHWVINSRTAAYHFGEPFQHTFTDPYAHGLHRSYPIFTRAATSFAEMIVPNAATAELIRYARAELASILPSPAAPFVATHIRRGDRRGLSWVFRNAPVPVAEHAHALANAWARVASSPLGDSNTNVTAAPLAVYVASDDPDAIDDLRALLPDDTLFLSLADSAVPRLRAIASESAYIQADFARLPHDDRVRLTTGAIVDFALVSGMWRDPKDEGGMPEASVCGVASNICKMTAIGLGWERAFGDMGTRGSIDRDTARWIDVDQKGAVVPEWEPFELF